MSPTPWAARGLALIAVLWMVAALSLLVMSMSTGSRMDVRLTGHLRDQVLLGALGDAAIEMALVHSRAPTETAPELAGQTPAATKVFTVSFEAHSIEVRMIPAQGFINLNTAPEALLKALWQHGAGLDEKEAETLAQRVLDWRDPDQAAHPLGAEREHYQAQGLEVVPRDGPFDSKADLLQVLGVDLARYARVQPLVTVYGNHALVNPLAASLGVLQVLAMGEETHAVRVFEAAAQGVPGVDTSLLEQGFIEQGQTGPVYRMEARILHDEQVWVRARWVDLSRVGPLGEPRFILETLPPFSEKRR